MKTAKGAFMVIVCAGLAESASATPTPVFSFTTLGDLPGGAFFSQATSISRDGTTIVGQSASARGTEAFRWTAASGMVGLGDLPGSEFSSNARAVSFDGSIIAGAGRLGLEDGVTSNRAFRWTPGTGIVDLGSIPPTNGFSNAWGMSGDGRYTVGTAQSPSGFEAFIHDASTGVMQGIGGFEGRAISDDATVAATLQLVPDALGALRVASRWTSQGGHETLGLLRPVDRHSDPVAMTPDGQIIVGWSAPTPGGVTANERAFVWTRDGGMQALASIMPGQANWINQATAISADGSIITGFERRPGDNEQVAVIWDAARGAINLQLFLESRGVSLEGFELISATGVSGDGRSIVGLARDPSGAVEAFLVTIPAPGLAPWAGLLVIGVSRRRR